MTQLAIATWRRLDGPGSEDASLHARPLGFELMGSATFASSIGPAAINYAIQLSPAWAVERAAVTGFCDGLPVDLSIRRTPAGEWSVNDRPCPGLRACADLDLGFSPATNLIPIRRLDLPVGSHAEICSAWLPLPDRTLFPLKQAYTRLTKDTYLYSCPSLKFETTLRTGREGLVTSYPPLWDGRVVESADG